MQNKLKERRERQQDAVDRGWPFNDPNYMCAVTTKRREVIRADGSKVIRISTKRNIITSRVPDHALRMMASHPSTSKADVVVPTKSPYSARGKWFRPKLKRVFTKLAVKLIIQNKGSLVNAGIKNPVSKKLLKGFTKMIPVFPPVQQLSKIG